MSNQRNSKRELLDVAIKVKPLERNSSDNEKAIETIYVRTKIENRQQNSKCILFEERYERFITLLANSGNERKRSTLLDMNII